MSVRAFLLLVLLSSTALHAELPTERYAPAQLQVAQDLLERAHAAAALGDHAGAGKLAWQAGLDARLAWQMSESPALRADAAELSEDAAALIAALARR